MTSTRGTSPVSDSTAFISEETLSGWEMVVSSSMLVLCLGLERFIGESSEDVWDIELGEFILF